MNPFDRNSYHPNIEQILIKTIFENDYIPLDRKPYPRQLWPIFEVNKVLVNYEVNEALIGAGGFGGKTILGSQLAAQYLDFQDYSCLVTRLNYAELTGEDSIWENLVEWVCDEERLGSKACKSHEGKLRIKAPSGAKIWFKAFDSLKKKQKVKSESYDRAINDEASELHPSVLQFIYRSLRNAKDSFIPLSMINLSNPGGPATDYLCSKYVDGIKPYYPLDWRHNPFINPLVYSKTLDNLDYVDQQYQKHGDWHYRPAKGDLFPEKVLLDSCIDKIPQVQIVRNIRGIDIAITKTGDYSAFVKWLQDIRGHKYVVDVVREQVEFPEHKLCEIIEKDNPLWFNGVFHTDYYIEKGVAESGVLAQRLILSVLEKYLDKGLSIEFVPPVTNKFSRARPMALDFVNKSISILKGTNVFGEEWIPDFISEYKDFGPNPKEYDHDDQVDGGSVGFNKLNGTGDPFTTSKKRYEAAIEQARRNPTGRYKGRR